MITQDLAILKTVKAAGSRLAGLDIGDRTIGVSLSDTTWQLATPLQTVERRGTVKDVAALCQLVQAHHIVGIVAGFPLNMNGEEGPQAQKVRVFADALVAAIDLPIVLWDERWSTLAASRALLEADLSRKKRSKVIDKVAASYILQGVLDAIR
ncbi:MAG: Holliday junction resolvase RuvX [Alphaproteobacteria bacterium]